MVNETATNKKKCNVFHTDTQNSWWDLEPEQYTMQTSGFERAALFEHIVEPSKAHTYNNVYISIIWRHFKFVS